MRVLLLLGLVAVAVGGCVELSSLLPSGRAPAAAVTSSGSAVSSSAPAWTSPYDCVVDEGNGRYTSCGAVQ
jgi:hypothetical protein